MVELSRSLRHDLGYMAVRGLFGAARVLPLVALRVVGRVVARVAWLAARRDVGTARDHLAAAFPASDPAWRETTMHAVRSHLGDLVGEIAWLWSARPEAILARSEWEGVEHLTSALATAHGAALITAHCGNWEWLNLALGARGVPMTIATKQAYDQRIERLARRLRGRFGGQSVARGEGAGRRLLVAGRRGRVVGFLIDQDIDGPGVFVEYFGRPAWTPSGAALIAVRAGIPVVASFATRLGDGRMRLTFDAPIEFERSADLEVDCALLTARLTARIESQVRRHPDQWVWMHQRWRRRPGPEDRVWSASSARPARAESAALRRA
jgi:Kdo2-lipid IVA lauroyltransferase/acyltransferase